MRVYIGMLCTDDMCAFHALYIGREEGNESERERKRHKTVDEKKLYHDGDKL